MSDFLCLRFEDPDLNNDSQLFWSIISSDGRIQNDSSCNLSDLTSSLPEMTNSISTILIVPSEEILLTSVSVPIKQQRHLNQVLDFVVEEHIVDPIESMHLSIAPSDGTENIDVAAIKKEKFQDWLSLFENINIFPDYCFADVLCVPQNNSRSQILYDSDKFLFRKSEHNGLSCDFGLIESLLSINKANNPFFVEEVSESFADHLTLILPNNQSIISNEDQKKQLISNLNLSDIDFKLIEYSESPSQLLSVNAVKNCLSTLNLLQNEFKPKSLNIENKRFLQNAGLSMLGVILLFLSISLIGGAYLNYQANKYFDLSISVYKEIFPQQKRIIDPVRQMKRQIQGQTIGGTVSDFLPLLDSASKALSKLDVDVESSITQLRYDSQRGQIVIDLRVQDIDTLESYKDLIASDGLSVSIISANQKDNMTNGRIQIGQPE